MDSAYHVGISQQPNDLDDCLSGVDTGQSVKLLYQCQIHVIKTHLTLKEVQQGNLKNAREVWEVGYRKSAFPVLQFRDCTLSNTKQGGQLFLR